jgi:hypothetical protein
VTSPTTLASGAPSTAPKSASVTTGGPVASAPASASTVVPAVTNVGAAFVTVSADQRIEVWARRGLLHTVRACNGSCTVVGVSAAAAALWFVDSGPGWTRLMRSTIGSTESPQLVQTLPVSQDRWRLTALAPDGRSAYLTRLGADGASLLRAGLDGQQSLGTSVDAAGVSAGGRLAYAERGERLGTLVIAAAPDEAERRIDLSAAADRSASSMPDGVIWDVRWSPDGRRLLLLVNPSEGMVWAALDLADASPSLRRLSPRESVPACWAGPTEAVVGDWVASYEADKPGPLARFDTTTGARLGLLGDGFAEVGGIACRDDGAVAMVRMPDQLATSGDLLVVNAQGTVTRLGTGYLSVTEAQHSTAPEPPAPPIVTSPATIAPFTPITANAHAFAATSADGKLEVWLPRGKVLTLDAPADCSPKPSCGPTFGRVSAVAITDRSVWYAGGYDGSLWRAPLDGSPPVLVRTVSGRLLDLTVAADDAMAWFVRQPSADSGRMVLERWANGGTTVVAPDGRAVALSPDGRRLAYTTYRPGDGASYPTGQVGELVVRELVSGAERRIPSAPDPASEPPFALADLRWSPDSTRLLVGAGWEGNVDLMLTPESTERIDHRSSGWSAPSCWVGRSTVLSAGWTDSMAPEARLRGDVQARDLTTGVTSGYGVRVFGSAVACRADGSAALVDTTEWGDPGDLVVVRPGGVRTVLGRGYLAVFPG